MSINHGTSSGYTSGCRQDCCRRPHLRAQKAWRLRRQRGYEPLVDAQPMRDHIASLQGQGMSFNAIALSAGWLSRRHLEESMGHKKVTRATYARVMAVTLASDTRPNRYVESSGAQLRLRALSCMGWTMRDLSERTGLDRKGITEIQNGTTPEVRAKTRDAISAIYDELWDTDGPSIRTRLRSRRLGWFLPMELDDDQLDDPGYLPVDTGGVKKPRHGIHVLIEDYMDTIGHHGGDTRVAAARLGIPMETLERALYRARHKGITVPMSRGDVVA